MIRENQVSCKTVAGASRGKEVNAGINDSLAAGLGLFPLGLAFGLMVMQAGLEWWVAPALSVAVYAGSLELLLVGMIAASAPIATIAITAFLVNFRHVFYAFSFPLEIIKNPLARIYAVYALTDETYAIVSAKKVDWTAPRLLAMQASLQFYWVGGGVAGVLLAELLPNKIAGLEFALCALFVTLTLDACRTKKEIPSFVIAGLSYTLALVVFPDSSLLLGLVLFVALLVVRFCWMRSCRHEVRAVRKVSRANAPSEASEVRSVSEASISSEASAINEAGGED